jgi:hypothetical protein
MKLESRIGQFESMDGQTAEAQLCLEKLSLKERTVAAFKRLAIGWALALVFVPIPGVHFIAVPGFLLGGVIAAFIGLTIKDRLSKIRGQCPLCRTQLEFPRLPSQERLKVHCPECRANLYLKPQIVAEKVIDS